MTENEFEYNKRFTYHRADGFEDNGKYITPYDAVYILNELNDENEQLKDALNQRTEQCDKYYKKNEKLKQQRDFYYARLQKIIKVANGDLE